MSVLVGIMSVVFGGYVAQPEWFNNGPFDYVETHDSLAECQVAGSGTSDICVGGSPVALRYTKFAGEFSEINPPQMKLQFVDCDYWAGCYIMKEEK